MKLCSLLAAFVSALVLAFAPALHAQPKPAAPTVYTVGQGETVLTIAKKLRYPAATENQMAYAIVRQNPNAFSLRTAERLLPGAKLQIPNEATVLYNAACTFANLNRRVEALDALRKAWDAGYKDADWTRRDPDLATLHGEPEFERLYPPTKPAS